MFGREKPAQPAPARPAATRPSASIIETTVGPNAYFRGDIQSDGGVRIEGIFEGTVDITGNLVIADGAKVIADVKANNISISGAIKGDITGNRVEILETGRVWGDLTINSLLLNEGAYLRGQTMMHGDIEPPMIEAPKTPKPAAEPAAPAPTIVDAEPKPPAQEQ
jgi:cytoskeletal protein CcmA (bactofilin family)